MIVIRHVLRLRKNYSSCICFRLSPSREDDSALHVFLDAVGLMARLGEKSYKWVFAFENFEKWSFFKACVIKYHIIYNESVSHDFRDLARPPLPKACTMAPALDLDEVRRSAATSFTQDHLAQAAELLTRSDCSDSQVITSVQCVCLCHQHHWLVHPHSKPVGSLSHCLLTNVAHYTDHIRYWDGCLLGTRFHCLPSGSEPRVFCVWGGLQGEWVAGRFVLDGKKRA